MSVPTGRSPSVNDTTSESSSLPTGDVNVDAALTRLDELDASDLERHIEIYDEVQAALGSVLDDTTPRDSAHP
jgi:hypothetical protein